MMFFSTLQETCESLKITDCFMDLVFIVDSSDSINERPTSGDYSNWDLVLDFIVKIIQKFLIGPYSTRVALINFGTEAVLEFRLNSYDTETELIQEVKSIRYLGGVANTAAAITMATNGKDQLLNVTPCIDLSGK